MTLSTTQIEDQAENHRAHISALIDELRTRVTPGEVLDQFLGWEDGHEVARNFGRQVKNNPLPLALIGTGVAWLMLSDGVARRNGGYAAHTNAGPERAGGGLAKDVSNGFSRTSDSVSDATGYAKSAARTTGAAIADTADQVSDSASAALDCGRQAASDVADNARDVYAKAKESIGTAGDSITATASSAWQRTTGLTQSATDSIRNAGSNLGEMAQEQPLLVAGLGFALGMALGAILPATEAENSLLGEQSDSVKEKAGDLAEQGYEKAKTVAQKSYRAATQAAREEAQSQGLTAEQHDDPPPSENTMSSKEKDDGSSCPGSNGGDHASGGYQH